MAGDAGITHDRLVQKLWGFCNTLRPDGINEENDLMQFWKHHSGHAIGLRYHEGPFLDVGDQTELKPGMVFTVEPGLYAANLGGFRHSDTVLITESGIEILTYYPRELESLIVPA